MTGGFPARLSADAHTLISDHVDAIVDDTIADEPWASVVQSANIPVVGANAFPPDALTEFSHALYVSSDGMMAGPIGPEQVQTIPTLRGAAVAFADAGLLLDEHAPKATAQANAQTRPETHVWNSPVPPPCFV